MLGPMVGEDLPHPDADALSLHTIAESEVYAPQEVGYKDIALSSSLRNPAFSAARTFEEIEDRTRDGGEGSTHDVPYRDDPDAIVDSADEGVGAFTTDESMQPDLRLRMRWTQHASRILASWTPALVKHALRLVAFVLLFIAMGLSIAIVPALRQKEVLPPTTKQRAFELSGSTSGNLVLQRLYPQLEEGVTQPCKNAWEELEGLSCPEAILSSAWDKGDDRHVRSMKMDIWAYSNLVCDESRRCEKAIHDANDKISRACTLRTNRFDFADYQARAYNYFRIEELDDGPVQTLNSLGARYWRLCDRATADLSGAPIEWGTHAAELWMKWGIADGKNADKNLRDVRTFIDATSEKKTIKRHIQRGSVETEKGTVPYKVEVLERKVGPGEGETDCGYSIRIWLERKWRSFEPGAVMNPRTDNVMGLAEFNELMETAAKRCEKSEIDEMLTRQHTLWKQYGWWCNGAPCREDRPVSNGVLRLVHGMVAYEWPMNAIRASQDAPNAPREVLEAFHDSLLSMPCSIWVNEVDIMMHIDPSDYRVRRLCSNECRNSVDRIQQQIGEKFKEASQNHWGSVWYNHWYDKRLLMNATCLGPDYNDLVTDTTPFCAPGYAVLNHPEWLLPGNDSPSNKDILTVFDYQIDKLVRSLPNYIPRPGSDAESQRRLARQVSESACNRCAIELLIGKDSDRKRRVEEFLHDDEVRPSIYKQVVQRYSMLCASMVVGTDLAKQKEYQWAGLDFD
jgi:hypothetical protein